MRGAAWACDWCGHVEFVTEGGPNGWLAVESLGDGTVTRPVTNAHLCSEECVTAWATDRIDAEVAA